MFGVVSDSDPATSEMGDEQSGRDTAPLPWGAKRALKLRIVVCQTLRGERFLSDSSLSG